MRCEGEALGKNLFEKNTVAFRHYESFSQAKKLWSFPKPHLQKLSPKENRLPTQGRATQCALFCLCVVKVSFVQYRFYCMGKFSP